MAILKINGVDMPSSSSLGFGIQDISKADRNARGTMIKEHIATKQKLQLSWSFLTAPELSKILTAVRPSSFKATYIDPVTNQLRTGDFYAGDRNVEAMIYKDGVPYYKELKFSITEM